MTKIITEPQDIEAVEPLTSLQKGMLFHALSEGQAAYVEHLCVRLDKMPDRAALGAAWARAMQDVDVLRSAFLTEQKPEPLRIVFREAPLDIRWIDFETHDDEDPESAWEELCQEDRAEGFRLRKPPLMRVTVARLAATDVRLLWSFHHLLLDGWSVPLLMRRIFAEYEAAIDGRKADLPDVPAYGPYRDWLSKRQPAEAFWRETLSDHVPATPLADALDKVGKSAGSFRDVTFELDSETTTAFSAFAERAGVTLACATEAALALALVQLTDADDILIGTTVSGRPHDVKDAPEMIGMFINTVPLRVRTSLQAPLGAWLTGLMRGLSAVQDRPETPLHDLRSWCGFPGHLPLFESIFVFENFPVEATLSESEDRLGVRDVAVTERTGYPLTVVACRSDVLRVRLICDTAFFSERQQDAFCKRLESICNALADGPDLDTSLGFIGLSLCDGFSGDIFCGSRGLFSDFVYESDLSGVLSGLGVFGLGVGVFLGRGAAFVSTVKGICRSGGYYVPLDPEYPSDRLSFMISDAGLRAVVTDAAGRARLSELGLCAELAVIVLGDDGAVEGAWTHGALPEPGAMTGDHPAYLCYTSGSTGRPKGVLVPVRAIERLVREAAYVDLGPGLRVAHLSSPSFDAATFEIWGTFLTGAELVCLPRAVVSDPAALVAALRASRVDVAFLTTALFNRVAREAPEGFRGMRQVLFGGEACDPSAVARVRAAAPDVRLVNVYGPTEATTFTTFWPVPEDWTAQDAVSIGRPIQGTVVHVLDSAMRSVPWGARGELWIGGPGVALGYWGRADLTADRFRPDPFSATPGARLYRTGDLVRWRDDNTLAFLGRADGQLKLRGHRIEPGEVEAALRTHPGVQDAAVGLQGAGTEASELVAWVVGDASRGALRAHLAERLPAVMRPGAIVPVAQLALTVNGKLDRATLPVPSVADRASDGVADGDGQVGAAIGETQALEQIVADIWADVLKLPDVGLLDDFFARGGHSLLVTRVVSRLRTVLGIEVPLRLLFDHPVLSEFAVELRARLRPDALRLPPLEPRGTQGPAPLSFAQLRLWVMARLAPLNPVWNVTLALELLGPLDAAALSGALDDIRARHAALRTRFTEVGGLARQEVLAPEPVALERRDLRRAADPEAALAAALSELAEAPFDLGSGEVLRGALIALPEDGSGVPRHAVSLSLHHIASDGWSLGVLMRELGAFYSARRRGVAADLPPLTVQYADFAVWQRTWLSGAARTALLGYWRRQLDGASELRLPLDRPRPSEASHRGAALRCEIPADVATRLVALSRAEGATLFMSLLAIYQGTLSYYAGQDDVVTGTPVAGRSHRETEELIGFFVNMLALRGDLSGDPDLGTLIGRLRAVILAAYAHQELPFEAIVEALAPERAASQHPLFQVHFALQSAEIDLPPLEDLTARPLTGAVTRTRFDLECHLWHESDGAIRGYWIYDTDLFDAATVEAMQRHFLTLLEQWSATPELPLSAALAGTQPASAPGALPVPARVAAPEPGDNLVARFLRQAGMRPEAPALVDGTVTIKYAALRDRAQKVARALRGQGLGLEAPVGLAARRGTDLIVGLLGILMAGARYVPLDPTYPAARLAQMAQDAGLEALLSDGADPVPGAVWRALRGRPVLEIGAILAGEAGAAGGAAALPRIDPDQLAYTLYTSGSTGRPKGVSVSHGNVLSLLDACAPEMAPGPQDRWCLFHAYAFDFSVWEIWGALAFGGALAIVPYATSRDPQAFRQFLAAQRITVLNQTPTAFYSLIGADREAEAPLSLRLVIFGGEALDPARLAPWWARHGGPEAGGPRLINMYGITETTVHVTAQDLTLGQTGPGEAGAGSPIGHPIASLSAHVLDAAMRPLPPGAPGELYVGGLGVARGYEGRADLTAARFVPDPFAARPGSRLYRSGDRVRRCADGSLAYLGRIDRQIQLRGHRVELGEIEALLSETPGVLRIVLETRDGGAGGPVLVAWVHDIPGRMTAPDAQSANVPDMEGRDGRIAAWQRIYDSTYETPDAAARPDPGPREGIKAPEPAFGPAFGGDPAEPGFDISGWTSSFTGAQIGADAMREWRDETCERIRALLPPEPRILEIGCGTGMLLFQLAREAALYQAVDLSGPVIARLRQQCAAQGLDEKVELVAGSAHLLAQPDLLPERPVDLVILNSVVQYFPSADYLRTVLRAAARRLAPEGRIFLGDLRDLARLPAFHAQVLRGRLPATTGRVDAAHRAATARAEETELVLAPAFFAAPDLCGDGMTWPARALWKRGAAETEMTLYRYDLVLGPEPRIVPESAQAPAEPESVHAPAASQAALSGLRGPRAVLTGLRDPRIVPHARLADWLARSPTEATASETMGDAPQDPGAGQNGAERPAAPAVLPRTLIAAASQHGFDACAVPAEDRPDGFDLWLDRAGPAWQAVPPLAPPAPGLATHNDPLRGARRQRIEAALRAAADAQLPQHMHPARYVFLEALPVSPSGKMLAQNLPDPVMATAAGTAAQRPAIAPRSAMELALWRAFTDVLRRRDLCVTDSFFQVGGNSLSALQLVSEIRTRLGRNLPLQAVFRLRSVEAIAAELDAGDAGARSTIVDLQPDGTAVPWFVAPPLGGSPLCYLDLARALAPDQPLYGLQVPGLWDGAPPCRRIEDMAAAYLADIRARFGAIPLRLAGWSAGGLVAYEMARQASAAGLEVLALLVFDAAPSSAFDPAVFRNMGDDIDLAAGILDLPAPPGETRDARLRALHITARTEDKIPPTLDTDQFESLVASITASQNAYVSYKPKTASPWNGPLQLLLARDNPQWKTINPETIWKPIATKLQTKTIPGNHNTMFLKASVESLKSLFKIGLGPSAEAVDPGIFSLDLRSLDGLSDEEVERLLEAEFAEDPSER